MLWTVAVALLIALSMYLSIAGWARERRIEREAFYEQEIARRMLERDNASNAEVVAWLESREARRVERRRESLRLAAFIACGAGLGMLAGLRHVSIDHTYWPLGFIPLMVGLAVAVYGWRKQS
jgi:ferric-dicitrate binding protein FerR (iron transport regulator)